MKSINQIIQFVGKVFILSIIAGNAYGLDFDTLPEQQKNDFKLLGFNEDQIVNTLINPNIRQQSQETLKRRFTRYQEAHNRLKLLLEGPMVLDTEEDDE